MKSFELGMIAECAELSVVVELYKAVGEVDVCACQSSGAYRIDLRSRAGRSTMKGRMKAPLRNCCRLLPDNLISCWPHLSVGAQQTQHGGVARSAVTYYITVCRLDTVGLSTPEPSTGIAVEPGQLPAMTCIGRIADEHAWFVYQWLLYHVYPSRTVPLASPSIGSCSV